MKIPFNIVDEELQNKIKLDKEKLINLGACFTADSVTFSCDALWAVWKAIGSSEFSIDDTLFQHIPSFADLNLSIRSNGALKSKSMRFDYLVTSKSGSKPDLSRRSDFQISIDGETKLIPADIYNLIKLIDNFNNDSHGDDSQAEFRFYKQYELIKEIATSSPNVILSGNSQRVDVIAKDSFPVEFGVNSANEPSIAPKLVDDDQKLNSKLWEEIYKDGASKNIYHTKVGDKRTRVYMSERCREAAKKLYEARVSNDPDAIRRLQAEIYDMQSDGQEGVAFELLVANYSDQVLGFTYDPVNYKVPKDDAGYDEKLDNENRNFFIEAKNSTCPFSVNLDNCHEEYRAIKEQLEDQSGDVNYSDFEISKEEAARFVEAVESYQLGKLSKYSSDELQSCLDQSTDNPIIIDDVSFVRDIVEVAVLKLRNEYNARVSEETRLLRDADYAASMGLPPEKSESDFANDIPAPHDDMLRPHQKVGFARLSWLLAHKEDGKIPHRGLLLADDMGVGKTFQVISFLDALFKKGELDEKPAIIIAPAALIKHAWEEDINKFAPGLAKFTRSWNDIKNILRGPHQLDQRILRAQQDIPKLCKVLLITWQSATLYHKELAAVPFKVVIIDEAQAIKNLNSKRSEALKCFKADFYCAMTGTPVENRLSDLYSIMEFVQSERFGSLTNFQKSFLQPLEQSVIGSEERDEIRKSIVRRLGKNWLRRTKEEVLDELPKRIDVPWSETTAPLTEDQIRLYRNILAKSVGGVLPLYHELQIVVNAPWLSSLAAENGYRATFPSVELAKSMCPKFDLLLSILERIHQKGEKALIFCNRTQLSDHLRHLIGMHFKTVTPKIFDGSSKYKPLRDHAVAEFKRAAPNEFDVMILNPRSAAYGITLTQANHVIHYTREWNPAVTEQATCRAYRMGQKKPVSIYFPTAIASKSEDQVVDTIDGSPIVDVWLARLSQEKKELIKDFTVSERDIKSLFHKTEIKETA
ncbi:MAG: DEAD/DEAH box helicase [Deltaproteobacteria bacterium]|nr:DEAD/DEAH box helicase [Deltaproteobacteria bacterium]